MHTHIHMMCLKLRCPRIILRINTKGVTEGIPCKMKHVTLSGTTGRGSTSRPIRIIWMQSHLWASEEFRNFRNRCVPGQCISSPYETLQRSKQPLSCGNAHQQQALLLFWIEIIPTFSKYVQISHLCYFKTLTSALQMPYHEHLGREEEQNFAASMKAVNTLPAFWKPFSKHFYIKKSMFIKQPCREKSRFLHCFFLD